MLFKDKNKKIASSLREQIVYFAHKGKIVGSFIIQNTGDNKRHISDLIIYEKYRNQGYGNLMVAEIIKLYENKCIPLELAVLAKNLPALHLYQKYGFKIYNDETSDVYWMKYEGN